MTDRYDVVIVGAGQGGAQTASALRQQQFSGTIALVGDEPDAPYERPALSKEYLAGEKPFEKMLLRPVSAWADKHVDLRLGKRVTAVDAAAHRVTLEDAGALEYGKLVWATGGAPRRLTCTGHDLRGVHTIRSRADVDKLRDELATTSEVVVIGGGYIGLEAAAVLGKLGKRVTVVEALDRVLARVAGEQLSRFYEAEHARHGVTIRLSAKVAFIDERDGRACGVRLESGEVLPADMVIVGIGITPFVEPLRAAGASVGDGVLVDLQGKTNLPDVLALGDCAAHPNVHARGAVIRLESIQNANDMAAVVAKTILGKPDRYEAIPWFWSNQWDLKLQTVGLSHGHDATVVRGNPDDRKFSLVYFREGKIIALDCVNAMKDYLQGKALIASGRTFDPAAVARADVELKSLLL
jgi:3-phenylpropionate/trans-cinnamate dioxygenase ferredoxin reductase component